MRSKQPSVRQLEYFVTVARSANFRKAAERLQVSQPTLTSQIAALEDSIGAQLFERSRAGTLLSPAGRELLPLARAVLDNYQELLDYTEARQQDLGGTYRIGVTADAGPWLLPDILRELRDLYPRLKLHFREAAPVQLEYGLAEGDFDLILTLLPLNSVDNQVRPLFVEGFDALLPHAHPLAEKNQLQLSDLDKQDLLGVEEPHLQRLLLQLCERSGAQLLQGYEGNSLSSLQQMVMMSMGIAFLPSLFVRHEINREHHLVIKPLRHDLISRTHVAAWRRNSPARQVFQKLSFDIKSLALQQFPDILHDPAVSGAE